MSSEVIEEIENQNKSKRIPDSLIEVRHTQEGGSTTNSGSSSSEVENLKHQIEERDLIIEAEAMKTFLENRDELLRKIPKDRREVVKNFVGDDPDKLAQIEGSLLLSGQIEEDDEIPESSPAGRARLPDSMLPPEQRGQGRTPTYQNPTVQQYHELYQIIRSPTSTEQQKQEAEAILDSTFVEVRRGLESRNRNNPYQLPTGVVSHCMNCGAVVEADLTKTPCPHCGFDWSKDKLPRNPAFQPK